MNADRLLAHYERIADAPDAVPRLRRFILDVVVRGKLVDQDPNDEPAAELLKRIAKEKARRVKAGGIKKSRAKPVNMVDPPFELPKSWKWAALGDLVLYDAGIKREPKTLNEELWLLELEDVEKDSGRLLVRITASARKSKSTKSEFRINDILYGKLRPYLNKVLVADLPGYSTTEIVALRPFLPLCSRYCALALRRPDFVDYVTRLGQGTKMPRLRTEDATIAPFPLPPLAEQHRIVAKVDELMALCDRLEKARAEREATRDRLSASSLAHLDAPDPDPMVFRNHAAFALEHLTPLTTRRDQIKALRQTILNLAVRGKLVAQDPNDEPAAELLRRIAKEKARLVKAKKIRAPRQVPVIDAGECSFDTPRGWEWKRLSEISRKIHYGLTASANNMIDVVRLLRITDIHKNSVDWVSVPGCEIDEKAIPQFKLEKGDILVARTGGTIGKSFLVQDVPAVVVFASYLIRVQGSHEMYDRYLKLFFESPTYWIQLQDGSKGTGQPNVNGQTLGKMLVPVPPLAEQQRIVAKVDELIALCDRLAASLATGDDTRCRLLGALLTEALECGESYVSEQAERATAHG